MSTSQGRPSEVEKESGMSSVGSAAPLCARARLVTQQPTSTPGVVDRICVDGVRTQMHQERENPPLPLPPPLIPSTTPRTDGGGEVGHGVPDILGEELAPPQAREGDARVEGGDGHHQAQQGLDEGRGGVHEEGALVRGVDGWVGGWVGG